MKEKFIATLKKHRGDPIQYTINVILGLVFLASVAVLFFLPFLLKVGQ